MCGIIAVLRRPSNRPIPGLPGLEADLGLARGHLESAGTLLEARGSALEAAIEIRLASAHIGAVDQALRGVPGTLALLSDPIAAASLESMAKLLNKQVELLDLILDSGVIDADHLEEINEALIEAKDAQWAVSNDRINTARSISGLLGGLDPEMNPGAVAAMHSVQVALSAIDRLEVRGRDSAGLQLFVTNPALELTNPEVLALIAQRADDRLFRGGAVCSVDGALAFVYKAAAEIGELGDNVAALRASISSDDLLHAALKGEGARITVLGHTRWASVGIISEANAHPLNSIESSQGGAGVGAGDAGAGGPYIAAVLNGDVDNFRELIEQHTLSIPSEITTDAKVIPALVSRALNADFATGSSPDLLVEAFSKTVSSFEGSMAIAAHSGADPNRLLLALRGSGQALYIGLADDSYVVASEPYGVVEEASQYIRLDGETPSDLDNPEASRGQIVVLDASLAGSLAGIERLSYDGSKIAVGASDLQRAEVTTRDIDRGDFPHFLLKEISESPASFRKTLRAKLIERDGLLCVDVGSEALPDAIRAQLSAGALRRVLVIGQGTAAVAGQSLAAALADLASSRLVVEALPATELSGFRLSEDMTETLVIAISQSGTTTDTNRTVDLVRSRGGVVISIVNRRGSDLTDRSDGVLYTSDGRDVEMSVASTKAFYAQIAAGFLLAFAIAEAAGAEIGDRQEFLTALRDLPAAMEVVLSRRDAARVIAENFAPAKRYWAVVGNGRNRIAAQEIRIKLSELCYKSIACDATEDKKHIDLSAEPLILVCAAGLRGSIADDVAKELSIYRAHKASAIAFVDDGEDRFSAAIATFAVPVTHPDLGFVLSAMAGHLFGYEAALAIDASAIPLRESRAAIEDAYGAAEQFDQSDYSRLGAKIAPLAERFFGLLRVGGYDGSLEAGTAVRLASLFRYATGMVPLDVFAIEWGIVGTPGVVIEALTTALTLAIDELTRPIDAIKHQAKTVTVGISRSDDALLRSPLVQAVLAAGAARDNLGYRVLRTLVALEAAVARVDGSTRYRIEGDPASDNAVIAVVERAGIGATFASRTEQDPRLRGTKQLVAVEGEVTIARGRSDGRIVVIVPEVKGADCVGLTLLHLELHEYLPPEIARGVLSGYRNRYTAIRSAVTETEPLFDDALLGDVAMADLLTVPVYTLADRWRER